MVTFSNPSLQGEVEHYNIVVSEINWHSEPKVFIAIAELKVKAPHNSTTVTTTLPSCFVLDTCDLVLDSAEVMMGDNAWHPTSFRYVFAAHRKHRKLGTAVEIDLDPCNNNNHNNHIPYFYLRIRYHSNVFPFRTTKTNNTSTTSSSSNTDEYWLWHLPDYLQLRRLVPSQDTASASFFFDFAITLPPTVGCAATSTSYTCVEETGMRRQWTEWHFSQKDLKVRPQDVFIVINTEAMFHTRTCNLNVESSSNNNTIIQTLQVWSLEEGTCHDNDNNNNEHTITMETEEQRLVEDITLFAQRSVAIAKYFDEYLPITATSSSSESDNLIKHHDILLLPVSATFPFPTFSSSRWSIFNRSTFLDLKTVCFAAATSIICRYFPSPRSFCDVWIHHGAGLFLALKCLSSMEVFPSSTSSLSSTSSSQRPEMNTELKERSVFDMHCLVVWLQLQNKLDFFHKIAISLSSSTSSSATAKHGSFKYDQCHPLVQIAPSPRPREIKAPSLLSERTFENNKSNRSIKGSPSSSLLSSHTSSSSAVILELCSMSPLTAFASLAEEQSTASAAGGDDVVIPSLLSSSCHHIVAAHKGLMFFLHLQTVIGEPLVRRLLLSFVSLSSLSLGEGDLETSLKALAPIAANQTLWTEWLRGTQMPPTIPNFDSHLSDEVVSVADYLLLGGASSPSPSSPSSLVCPRTLDLMTRWQPIQWTLFFVHMTTSLHTQQERSSSPLFHGLPTSPLQLAQLVQTYFYSANKEKIKGTDCALCTAEAWLLVLLYRLRSLGSSFELSQMDISRTKDLFQRSGVTVTCVMPVLEELMTVGICQKEGNALTNRLKQLVPRCSVLQSVLF